MKKFALFAVLALCAPGCSWFQGGLKDDVAVSLKTSTDKVLPQYEEYVKADQSIPGSVKKVRLDNAAEFRKLIEEIQPKD